jgi:hypothetical protein
MSFVIVLNETGKIVRPRQYAPNYASIGAAKAGATTMVKKGYLSAGAYSVMQADRVPPVPVAVVNLLSGETVMEDINTPYCCSVASESYWSN